MDDHAMSIAGLLLFPLIAWLFSNHRRTVNWRVVGWGLGLQLLFGFIVFRFPLGRDMLRGLNNVVIRLVEAAMAGPRFVFGPLSYGSSGPVEGGGTSIGFILAFQALPTIIVFSALIAILYYTGVMQALIRMFSWVFTRLMRISGAESLCASSNIFVGIESALTVRPHLQKMTRSEFCTVLTVCMATVASNVMAAYVLLLKGTFGGIAGHLISASILSAPAALVMSKLICPETGTPATLGTSVTLHYEKEESLFAAIIGGAENGLKLIFGIVALLVAIVGLTHILDLGLVTAGRAANQGFGWEVDWSLQALLGHIFYPLARLMGVPSGEVNHVSELLGMRVIMTEFAAYIHLNVMLREGVLSARTATIAAYALCGFAHIPSVAIFVGGITALVPERRSDITRVAWRALVASTLACLMTGAMAGLFCEEGAVLLSQ